MSDSYKKIRVFLSSPNDVPKEREAVAEIIDLLNRTIAGKRGLILELLRWEIAVPSPGLPQDVINAQLQEYDIFIGIMWKRFGTPTQKAGSGTEEEFDRAYQAWLQTQFSPHILFYFCERPVPFPATTDEVEQLKKVVAFKKRVMSIALCATYYGRGKFKWLVQEHLMRILLQWPDASPTLADNYPDLSSSNTEFNNNASSLNEKIDRLKWIVYAPVDFDPDNGIYPSEESLKEDLSVLASSPFSGIVTFGSEKSLSLIPQLAKEVGIKGLIMGIFDPRNPEELQSAISSCQDVDGYCVGHRGVNTLYDLNELGQVMEGIRKVTKRPVSTSEALIDYTANPEIIEWVDWFFPDVHYYWHEGAKPEDVLDDLMNKIGGAQELFKNRKGRRVCLKMISYPSSGGHGLTEAEQAHFFRLLLRRFGNDITIPKYIRCCFFAAFDNKWKTMDRGWSQAELSTGMYTLERSPKPVIQSISNPWRETNEP